MKVLVTLALSLCCIIAISQNIRNEKFGTIKVEDFNPTSPVIDEDAAAVVLSDVGSSEFVGNNNGWFTLKFKLHKKVLIRKRTAFDEATLKLTLYNASYDTEEKLEGVEAATYNLVNGQIVTSKLQNKEDILKQKIDKNNVEKKFTLPDVKEGCIIEYQYTITRQNIGALDDWYFQDEYPVLWSEYHVVIPPMFNYLTERKGMIQQYTIDSSKKEFKTYRIIEDLGVYGNQYYTHSGDAKWALWALKDIPAIKQEPFTTTLKNHVSRIEFYLYSIRYSETNTKYFIENWYTTALKMLKSPDFGDVFDAEKNTWVGEEAKAIVGNATAEEAAKKMYYYMRDNFSCTSTGGKYFTNEPKKIWKEKKGRTGDINLLLTALLKHQGFEAHPVILSTRQNGIANDASPLLYQYNYLICKLTIDSTDYLLDASDKHLGFGKIPLKCYNGNGRKIAPMPTLVNLNADNLLEAKNTSIFIINAENKKGKMEASFSTNLGYYESLAVRDELANTKKEDWFKKMAKSYSFEVNLTNPEIENEKDLEQPLTIKYEFDFGVDQDDIIYFTPLLGEVTKENPFKSATRNYPVEMDFAIDETIVLDMEIPQGFMVDEMPKSTRVKLFEEEGMFEYIIAKRENKIMLRSRISIKKANFYPDDYETLRNFWGMIVKKHAEQIVFKRIK